MGDNYDWGVSPMGDFLFQIMLLGNDITDPKYNAGIIDSLTMILHSMGVSRVDITTYLDFKFKADGILVRVVPANIVCAIWFIGLMPKDIGITIETNHMMFMGGVYKFNKKTKRLKWVEKK